MVEFVVWMQSTAFADLIVVITELVYELQDKNLEESLDSLQSSSLSFSITQLVEEGSVCVCVCLFVCAGESCERAILQVWYVASVVCMFSLSCCGGQNIFSRMRSVH